MVGHFWSKLRLERGGGAHKRKARREGGKGLGDCWPHVEPLSRTASVDVGGSWVNFLSIAGMSQSQQVRRIIDYCCTRVLKLVPHLLVWKRTLRYHTYTS